MSRNKLPPMMGESLRCDDEEAYHYVAKRTPFNGNVFSSKWHSNDHVRGERYVVSAWRYARGGSQFIPLLIWEGRYGRDRGMWYSVTGEDSWMCNALNAGIFNDGDSTTPLTPKDMRVMVNYGIGGVALDMGAGIEEERKPTGIYALDNNEGEKK